MSEFLARLKTDTLELHRDAEERLPLLRADFNHQGYVDYLQKIHGIYRDFEPHMEIYAPQLDRNFDMNARKKIQWIVEDLQGMNASAGLSSNLEPFQFSSKAGFVGGLYVVEGSTLGGQILYKRLVQSLKLDSSQTRFLRGYGEQTGPMWLNFRRAVDQEGFQEHEYPEMLNGARQVFGRF